MTTPEDARTLAFQIAVNAVNSQLTRVHGRTRWTFADAYSAQMIQSVLCALEPAGVDAASQEMTDLDHGQGKAVTTEKQAAGAALGIRPVVKSVVREPEDKEPPAGGKGSDTPAADQPDVKAAA